MVRVYTKLRPQFAENEVSYVAEILSYVQCVEFMETAIRFLDTNRCARMSFLPGSMYTIGYVFVVTVLRWYYYFLKFIVSIVFIWCDCVPTFLKVIS